MGYRKRDNEEQVDDGFIRYSNGELAAFTKELEKYRVHVEFPDGRKGSYIKWEDWLVDCGVMKHNKRSNGYLEPMIVLTERGTRNYRELMNKIKHWRAYMDSVEYAKKQADKDYALMSAEEQKAVDMQFQAMIGRM